MATKNYWERFQRQRVSRRRLLATAGAGAAGLAVVAACGDGGGEPGPETPRAEGTPKPGGVYKDATDVISDAFFGLHPYLAIAAGPAYFARMYNALFNQSAVDPRFRLDDLASGYEMPDPEGLEHIFTIRPNVMIAPNTLGVPERALDAQDCKASYDIIQTLDLANACQFVCQYFQNTEALENNTVFKITLSKPYAWFQVNIGRAINLVIPRELTEVDAGTLRNNGAGGGAFQITPGTFVEGEGLKMHKHPSYWRASEGVPYMDGWDIRIIPDRAGRRAAFINQQAYDYGASSESEVDELLAAHDLYLGSEDPTYTFIAFTMNVLRPPFDDPRIRKAALYALNRDEFVQRVYEGAAKPNGIVHWPVAGALDPEELAELQPYDPERSKQLIQDAGHDLPLRINCMFPGQQTIEEHDTHLPIWLVQMEDAGFSVNQEALDIATWLTRYRQKDYDSSLALNQIYETAEIPLDFSLSIGPAGSDIYTEGMQDPEVDAAIDGTKQILDFDERVEAVKQVQRLLYEKGPMFIPIVTPLSRTLYWNFVKNIPTGIGTSGFFLTHQIWLDI